MEVSAQWIPYALNDLGLRMARRGEDISESIIQFCIIIEQEMTIESGELTPTLKVKRRVIRERYGQAIEELYS